MANTKKHDRTASPALDELVAAQLSTIEAEHERQAAELAELRQKVGLARGTRDIAAVAQVPVKARGPHHVGDDGPTPELIGAIAALLSERPMTHAEIVEGTGARPGRISGCLVEMRRARMPIVNVGTRTRALYWFITPDMAARARENVGGRGQ